MKRGIPKIRAISSTWKRRVSKNCASAFVIDSASNFVPCSRIAVAPVFSPLYADCQFVLSRWYASSERFPGMLSTPPGFAPFAKVEAPCSCAARVSPIVSRWQAMGEIPVTPSTLRYITWNISRWPTVLVSPFAKVTLYSSSHVGSCRTEIIPGNRGSSSTTRPTASRTL